MCCVAIMTIISGKYTLLVDSQEERPHSSLYVPGPEKGFVPENFHRTLQQAMSIHEVFLGMGDMFH